ncbi:MAG: glycerophosphodiester phosphodiesterase [Dehalococcoidia bacterium]
MAPLRIAHGFGNSRELIRIALENRVDVVEADVRLRGSRLWLGHDPRLPLLPVQVGRRPINQPPPAHRALRLSPWEARLDLDPLPLAELLVMVDGRCQLLLDLKATRGTGSARAFVETLIGQLRRSHQARTARLCGDWPLLDEARRVAPELRTYYSVADRRRWQALGRRLEEGEPICGVSLRGRLLNWSTADFLRKRGLEIFCWSVEDHVEAARVARLGVDGVISSDLTILSMIGAAPQTERR